MLNSQDLASEVTVERLNLGETSLFIYMAFGLWGPLFFLGVSKIWHTHVVAVVHV